MNFQDLVTGFIGIVAGIVLIINFVKVPAALERAGYQPDEPKVSEFDLSFDQTIRSRRS